MRELVLLLLLLSKLLISLLSSCDPTASVEFIIIEMHQWTNESTSVGRNEGTNE